MTSLVKPGPQPNRSAFRDVTGAREADHTLRRLPLQRFPPAPDTLKITGNVGWLSVNPVLRGSLRLTGDESNARGAGNRFAKGKLEIPLPMTIARGMTGGEGRVGVGLVGGCSVLGGDPDSGRLC